MSTVINKIDKLRYTCLKELKDKKIYKTVLNIPGDQSALYDTKKKKGCVL